VSEQFGNSDYSRFPRIVFLTICGQFLIILVICDIGFLDDRKAFASDVNEEEKMGFVNEYASDEDIEKYNLHGIWDQYHPFRKGEYYGGNKPNFTIDREKNIFFMVIKRGIREEGNQAKFLLWWNGIHIVGRLKQEGGSSELDANPFYRVWHLLELDAIEDNAISETEIKRSLKAALKVYGYWGVRRQIPNTLVEFMF